MRYFHTNNDGSVGLWSTVPARITDHEDAAVFVVTGLSRNATQTMLTGYWTGVPYVEFQEPNGRMQTQLKIKPEGLVIGDQNFDAADLEADSLAGYTIEFPEFARDIKAKLHASIRDKIASHREGGKSEIPTDYSFRAAWRDTGKTIAIDMPKAKEITRERLRKDRAPLLAALDVEAIKAVEADDKGKLAQVAAEKQRLRDITALPSIDAAKTPEELKAISVETASLSEAEAIR